MSDWKNVQYKDGKMRTSEGGGGSSTLAGLNDVDLNDLQDGQIIKWDATTEKFVNTNESGGGSEHTYSETEQVIGTWTNGKPLYEKTYLGDLDSSASYMVIGTLSNVDVVLAFGSVKNQSNMNTMQIGSYVNSTYYTGFYMGVNGTLQLYYGNDLRGYKYRLVLQYTKTTD